MHRSKMPRRATHRSAAGLPAGASGSCRSNAWGASRHQVRAGGAQSTSRHEQTSPRARATLRIPSSASENPIAPCCTLPISASVQLSNTCMASWSARCCKKRLPSTRVSRACGVRSAAHRSCGSGGRWSATAWQIASGCCTGSCGGLSPPPTTRHAAATASALRPRNVPARHLTHHTDIININNSAAQGNKLHQSSVM